MTTAAVSPIDPAAAFPTAAMVAYHRCSDAASSKPLIGRNIGGGPDAFAETFAGELGRQFCEDLGSSGEDGARMILVARTMFYDELWMQALDDGCKQFVLLAAGLDARAWRMPRHDPSVKIFELDVPRCFTYKHEKLTKLSEELTTPCCTRVPVEVDLSDPIWGEKLVGSGFDPSSPAFFLAEGLLMYLPPQAVPGFLGQVSALLSVGSTFAGCMFIACLDAMPPLHDEVFAKYGTKFTFEASSEGEMRQLLGTAKLEVQQIQSAMDLISMTRKYQLGLDEQASNSELSDGDKARSHAQRLLEVCSSVDKWSLSSRDHISRLMEDSGCRSCAEYLVQDEYNILGLRDQTSEQKTKIAEILVELNFEAALTAALEKAKVSDTLAQATPGTVDEEKAQQQAQKIMTVVCTLKWWPEQIVKKCWQLVQTSGYKVFATEMIDDPMNFQGLKSEPPAQKARVLELVMGWGFEQTAKPLFEEAILTEANGATGYVHFVARKV